MDKSIKEKIIDRIYGRVNVYSDDGEESFSVRPKVPVGILKLRDKLKMKKLPRDKVIHPFVPPGVPSELVAEEMRKRGKSKMV